jgi:hypothetical protein
VRHKKKEDVVKNNTGTSGVLELGDARMLAAPFHTTKCFLWWKEYRRI